MLYKPESCFQCFRCFIAPKPIIRYGPEFDTFAENLFVRSVSAILLFFFYAAVSTGQIDSLKQKNDTLQSKSYLLQNVKRNGETLPEVEIKEVTVYAHPAVSQRKAIFVNMKD
jgi:hypothetical protein